MSLCSLKSKLKSFSLSRKTHFSPLNTVRAAIQEELKGPGQHYGYRSMWQILRQKYSLTMRRDDVMTLTRELDPSGVPLRARRRFVRRVYSSCGPNHERHLFSGSRGHACLVRFVFLGVLQRDLDESREKWNTHAIRPVNQSCCP
ncbi:hypothetical protein FQN60_009272, partial [Etheostoma spectabile]